MAGRAGNSERGGTSAARRPQDPWAGCSMSLYQDYGGFPLVPDARLRQWAAMLERNSDVPVR